MEEKEFNFQEIKLKLRNGIYYILTALLSIVSIVVFPMLDNSKLTLKDAFPTTPTAWIIWTVERVLIVVMNMLILNNFILQARINIKDDPNYKKANEILNKNKPKNYKPRSPQVYLSKAYIKKGVMLTLTTLASLIAIGEAAVNYNYLLLIATIVTVILAIVFGVVAMRSTEIYWTTEYLDYANYIQNNKISKEEINKCLQSMESNIEIYKSK